MCCVIDRNPGGGAIALDEFFNRGFAPSIIIVTPFLEFGTIYENLQSGQIECPVIPIDEVLFAEEVYEL